MERRIGRDPWSWLPAAQPCHAAKSTFPLLSVGLSQREKLKNGAPEKRGVPNDAPQFSFKRVQLELDADTHFHRSWGRSLLREQPELCRRACNGEGGIQQ